jgi:hypothetical protein
MIDPSGSRRRSRSPTVGGVARPEMPATAGPVAVIAWTNDLSSPCQSLGHHLPAGQCPSGLAPKSLAMRRRADLQGGGSCVLGREGGEGDVLGNRTSPMANHRRGGSRQRRFLISDCGNPPRLRIFLGFLPFCKEPLLPCRVLVTAGHVGRVILPRRGEAVWPASHDPTSRGIPPWINDHHAVTIPCSHGLYRR